MYLKYRAFLIIYMVLISNRNIL